LARGCSPTNTAIALLGEPITPQLVIAGLLMAFGIWLYLTERHAHDHTHETIEHEHSHLHDDPHRHAHEGMVTEPHSHWHRHEPLRHQHAHYPDIHQTARTPLTPVGAEVAPKR
jgi:hypothetical protein